MTNGTFSGQQVEYLLKPLNKARVETRKQGGATLSYVNQADMRAHAIRLFGFGNFDIETIDTKMLFETEISGRWMCGWLATVQVTIRNEHGQQVCRYSESAVGGPMGPMASREDAHDMALKTATSDAMKRCFINIGDQGGLGLYDNGSLNPFVKDTIIKGVQSLNDEKGSPDLPAPDSDEPGLSPEAVEFLGELSALCEETDSKARILGIAGLKSKYAGLGSVFSPVHEVTLGVLADRVAATGAM